MTTRGSLQNQASARAYNIQLQSPVDFDSKKSNRDKKEKASDES